MQQNRSVSAVASEGWTYDVVDDFLRLPAGRSLKSAAAVAVDKNFDNPTASSPALKAPTR